jgi:hypothetical protein
VTPVPLAGHCTKAWPGPCPKRPQGHACAYYASSTIAHGSVGHVCPCGAVLPLTYGERCIGLEERLAPALPLLDGLPLRCAVVRLPGRQRTLGEEAE